MTTLAGARPPVIEVPLEIQQLVDRVGQALAGQDPGAWVDLLSASFLFQGMRAHQFVQHVQGSFVASRVRECTVLPTAFAGEVESPELIAFAETNLGVLPQAEDVMPLVGGCHVVHESGTWKLQGNQSRAPRGIYGAFRSITATTRVDDVDLFRKLLPDPLELPEQPILRIVATDYPTTTLPLVPYLMLQVQLACRFARQSGWHTLTLPETAWMPVEGGRTLGYPKYVADELAIVQDGDGWQARCVNGANPALTVQLRFTADTSTGTWFERRTRGAPLALLRKMLPGYRERPWFLLMNGLGKEDQRELLLVRGDPVVIGLPNVRESFGSVSVSVAGDQPWVKLCEDWTSAPASLMEYRGRLNLGHRLVQEVPGGSERRAEPARA